MNLKNLFIDLFCGAGGVTSGIHEAVRRGQMIAEVIACVNHDKNAIRSHAANFPNALHLTEDIRTVALKPILNVLEARKSEIAATSKVLLHLWASLECINFSRAKGGMSRNADSRTLAEHLFRYIKTFKPDYIWIENVEEFMDWGPLQVKELAKNPEDDKRRIEAQRWNNKNTPDEIRNGIRPRKSGNKSRKTVEERGCPENTGSNVCGSIPWEGMMANKRSVWTVNTKPYKEAHFATFPGELIEPCIKAGSPEGGMVYDPFMGSGTTAEIAAGLGRHFLGTELNPEYCIIAHKRVANLFNTEPIVNI